MNIFFKSISIIFIVFILSVLATAGEEFVGSKTSNKYHAPTCKWVKEIKSHRMIKFSSPEEAAQAGYIPCPTCRPPLPNQKKTDKKSEKTNPQKPSDKTYTSNIILSSVLLLLLLFVPFLPGLLEIKIERKTLQDIGKKDSVP